MKPIDVTRKNAAQLFDYMELRRKRFARKRKNKYDLGDLVRIPINFKKKKEFVKYGSPIWTAELYQISRIEFGTHRPTYFLCDLSGQPLAQRFYSDELNLVSSFVELSEEPYSVANFLYFLDCENIVLWEKQKDGQ